MTRCPEMEAAAELARKYMGPGGSGFQNDGRMNAYVCDDCDRFIVTVDREPGVTPFTVSHKHAAPDCGKGWLTSKMYRVADHLQPTHEFYRPDSLGGFDRNTAEHLRKGGLLLRAIPGRENALDAALAAIGVRIRRDG